jgi:hypothetical protein
MPAAAQSITINLQPPHKAQQKVISESTRFNVLACGRRFGKTELGKDRIIGPLLDGHPVGWFSPTYRMLSEVWREVCITLAPITRNVRRQEHRLDLITGGWLEMWSLDMPDIARGRKYKRVVIDEAAMVRDLNNAWTAVIRPTLADYAGDAWFLSTPRGLNYFYTLYNYGQDDTRPEWKSWRMPTWANPFIPLSEINDMRRDMPENIFRQEIMAEFLEDGSGVFRGITDLAVLQPQLGPRRNHDYVIGADWARTNDWTVFSVLDITAGQQAYLDRFQQIDYRLQKGRLSRLNDLFKPLVIVAERNNFGDPLIQDLKNNGLPILPFTTTHASKKMIIDDLALNLEQRKYLLLDDPIQIGELLAYQVEELPSGVLRYGAPPGQHDDCVMGLALADHGANMPRVEEDRDLAKVMQQYRGF